MRGEILRVVLPAAAGPDRDRWRRRDLPTPLAAMTGRFPPISLAVRARAGFAPLLPGSPSWLTFGHRREPVRTSALAKCRPTGSHAHAPLLDSLGADLAERDELPPCVTAALGTACVLRHPPHVPGLHGRT